MKSNLFPTLVFVILAMAMLIYVGFSGPSQWHIETPALVGNSAAEEETTGSNAEERRAFAGYRAPEINTYLFDTDEYVSLEEYDRPLIINFWASWCEPCHIEAPDLVAAYERHGEDIELLAVNMTHTDQEDGIRAFIREYGISFPVLMDPEGEISTEYQILAIPTTLFVDRHGVIQHVTRGMVTESDLETQISKLLE